MTATRVCISTVLLVVGLAIAPVAGVALADGAFILGDVVDDDEEPTDESSMGAEVSTFMQASATDASEGADRGMFEAAYETADDDDEREDLLTEQTAAFTSKYDHLESQLEELEEQKENDDITPMVYDAQLTRITVQLSSLESSINETESRADDADIDTSEFDEIREDARNLAGPEVARIATDLDGIDPPGLQNDPAEHDENSSESDSDEPGHDVDSAALESDELGYGVNASEPDTDPPDHDDESIEPDTDPPDHSDESIEPDTDPSNIDQNSSESDTDPPGFDENPSEPDTDPPGPNSGLPGQADVDDGN